MFIVNFFLYVFKYLLIYLSASFLGEYMFMNVISSSRIIYFIIMYSPSWQIDGETTETVTDFIFLGSKITVDADYSHEMKRHSPLERKAMTNLCNILKSRDITLPTKISIVKAMVFPVVMYRCESWTVKKG